MPRIGSRRGIVFVISAPSGTGKTTLSRRLLRRVPGLRFSVSYTTRPARRGEKAGSDYRFLSPTRFESRRRSRELLEWAKVDGHHYGTSRREVERCLARGEDLVLDIDTQGAAQVHRRLPQAVLIFLLPPGPAALRRRHQRRGSEPETVSRRLALARQEVGSWRRYQYLVVNDDLERAYRDLEAIVRAERCRAERQQDTARAIVAQFKTLTGLGRGQRKVSRRKLERKKSV